MTRLFWFIVIGLLIFWLAIIFLLVILPLIKNSISAVAFWLLIALFIVIGIIGLVMLLAGKYFISFPKNELAFKLRLKKKKGPRKVKSA